MRCILNYLLNVRNQSFGPCKGNDNTLISGRFLKVSNRNTKIYMDVNLVVFSFL